MLRNQTSDSVSLLSIHQQLQQNKNQYISRLAASCVVITIIVISVIMQHSTDWNEKYYSTSTSSYVEDNTGNINLVLTQTSTQQDTAKVTRAQLLAIDCCIIIIIIIIIITRLIMHVKSFTEWGIVSAGGHESAKVSSVAKFSLY